MKMYYAAVSPTGELIGIEESPESAVRLVKQKVDGPISVETLSDKEEMVSNPPSAEEMPELAERNVQIPRISMDAVMAMDAEKAHELLMPFFAGLELRDKAVKKYRTPSGMTDAWIGQNYKTQKPTQDPRRPVEVMGLTLVPAFHPRLAAIARQDKDIPSNEKPPYKNPYENLFRPSEDFDDESARRLAKTKITMLERWKDPSTGLPSRIKSNLTWCQGSSPECRSSCLIFAGQNASERYNTYRKVAQSHALLHQPVAFMRILLDAIDTWMADCTFYRRPHRGMELTPMFRLNVLSDIPWERIAPWFFSYYQGKSGENGKHFQAYDYTKVPGRRAGHRDGNRFVPFPDNYDLTFSLSGTDINEAYALEEIDRYTSRIAAVFLAYRNDEGKWQTFTPKPKKAKEGVREEDETMQQLIPLPKRFKFGPHDMRVRDGDLSDARPNDPHGVCVGLRWKIPSGKRSGAEDLKFDEVVINGQTVSMAKMSFVTPIYVKGTKPSRYEPNPDDDGAVLIAPVTPRQQSIDHTLSQGY